MWCERIVRNAGDVLPNATSAIDYVDIDWTQCGRVLKTKSRAGQEIRVLLPPADSIKHGDVLFEDAERTIVINVRPCEVIVARPSDPNQMALLALELGNLHWPTQIDGNTIIFPQDGPAMEILAKLNIASDRQTRRFSPATVNAGPTVKRAGGFQVLRGGMNGR